MEILKYLFMYSHFENWVYNKNQNILDVSIKATT